MARQTGTLMLTGTIGNVTYYKMNGKYLARSKRHVSKKRLIRETIIEMTKGIKDATVARRLLQKMIWIMKLDSKHATGSREVNIAMQTNEGKILLNGFEFNNKAHLDHLLKKHPDINVQNEIIKIEKLNPHEDMKFPKNATHWQLQGAYVLVDFLKNTGIIEVSNKLYYQLIMNFMM